MSLELETTQNFHISPNHKEYKADFHHRASSPLRKASPCRYITRSNNSPNWLNMAKPTRRMRHICRSCVRCTSIVCNVAESRLGEGNRWHGSLRYLGHRTFQADHRAPEEQFGPPINLWPPFARTTRCIFRKVPRQIYDCEKLACRKIFPKTLVSAQFADFLFSPRFPEASSFFSAPFHGVYVFSFIFNLARSKWRRALFTRRWPSLAAGHPCTFNRINSGKNV